MVQVVEKSSSESQAGGGGPVALVGPHSPLNASYATSPSSPQRASVGVIIPVLQIRKVKLKVAIAELLCNKARIQAWIGGITPFPLSLTSL